MSNSWRNPVGREEDEEEAVGRPRGYGLFIPHPNALAGLPVRIPGQSKVLGAYKGFFRGHLVLGPQPCLLLFHTVLFLILLGLFCLQIGDVTAACGRSIIWYAGLLVYSTSIALFLTVSLTDPGVVPMHYSLHELIRDTASYRARNPGQRFYRFCTRCEGFRPPKCYHCKVCNICIKGQQLHMNVGGTCVGERNVVSYLFLSLSLGILAWYLVVVNAMILSRVREPVPPGKTTLAVTGLLTGVILVLIPNVGIFCFFYRLWTLATGRQTRVFFDATRGDELDCPRDTLSVWRSLILLFCSKNRNKSAFRSMRMINQVAPFGRMSLGFIENLQNWLDDPGLARSTDSREIIQMHIPRNQDTDLDLSIPPPRMRQEESEEALLLRALAVTARLRQTPSVPDLDRSKKETSCCFRQTNSSKRPKALLKSKSSKHRQVTPTSALRCVEENLGVITLSDGNIPSTLNGEELIQTARAEQFRRLIHLILLRDRSGILQMSRRVNLAGLLGLDRFDPDNLQFVELSNGLPMIAPRRRDPQAGAQNANQNRFGGLLGIPQMVAAGLLPTARVMAQDVENSLGLRPGSVIRVNNTVTLPAAAREPTPRGAGSSSFSVRPTGPRAERHTIRRHSLRSQAQEQLHRLISDQRRLLQTQEETLRALRNLNETEMRANLPEVHGVTSGGQAGSNGSGTESMDLNNNTNTRNTISDGRRNGLYSAHGQESSSSDDQ